MSETDFLTYTTFFPAGAELLYASALVLFLKPFIAGQGYKRRKPAVLFGIYLACRTLCDRTAAPQGTFGLLLMALLVLASRGLGLEKTMAFLLTLLYWNIRVSSGLMAESLYFIAERLLPVHFERLEEVYLSTAAAITLFLLIHAALMAVMLCILQHQIKKQPAPFCWRELCYISLIPMAGILFGQMISRLLLEFKDGIFLQLYERHPAFSAIVPVLALLFYAGTFLTITFQQGMRTLQEEQAGYTAQRQQTQAIEAQIHEMEHFYSRIRQLKHEMRNHLANIKGLAQTGAYASLEGYISQMDKSIRALDLTLQTGNPVTDVIINSKRQQCLDLGIAFQTDFHYPASAAYDAFDMGIILHNLLQNALEACEKADMEKRFITLAGRQKGRFFLVEVKNSFTGQVAWGHNGLPATTKQAEPLMHGIGLSNVRRTAEKYMGELDLKVDQQKFCATVLLQERSGYESCDSI